MNRIALVILCSGALLMGVWSGQPALAVDGLAPFINGATTCDAATSDLDATCADTYELRCLQESVLLCFELADIGDNPDCVQGSLVATRPLALVGESVQELTCAGGSSCIFSPAGPRLLRGLASVWVSSNNDAGNTVPEDPDIDDDPPRDYRITAKCFGGNTGVEPRNTRIILKDNN